MQIIDDVCLFKSLANNNCGSKSRRQKNLQSIWQIRLMNKFNQVNHVVEEWGCDLHPDS